MYKRRERQEIFLGVLITTLLIISGCAVRNSTSPVRIALLAPFEGRYREIGYNALYAARLGLADAGLTHIELLPIDDGGTINSAVDRIQALAQDPLMVGVIALGYHASAQEVQQAARDLPIVIVGHWDTAPIGERVFILSSPMIAEQIIVPPRVEITDAGMLTTPLIGGDILMLEQFANLRESLTDITVISSGRLPDQPFIARYQAGNEFAPQPNLLAPLVYDATQMMVQAASGSNRASAAQYLAADSFEGISGTIRFVDGYWQDAPIHRFGFNSARQLIAVEDIVE